MPFSIISAPASGNVVSVAYDPDAQKLRIQFAYQDSIYEYDGISEDLARGFSTAISATRYLNDSIRPLSAGERIQ